MYLVDTNIWLERLLDQEKSEDVEEFLGKASYAELFISDFTFHSIGIIMTRLDKKNEFLLFAKDLFEKGMSALVRIEPGEVESVVSSMDNFQLDFDDAYQLECARKYNMKIVSFDTDFQRADLSVLEPKEV